MYKIVACDLDETLLGNDRTISKRNIMAIKQASSLGIKFIPATGRGYNSVEDTLEELKLEEWDKPKVLEIFRELNFKRYIERFGLAEAECRRSEVRGWRNRDFI